MHTRPPQVPTATLPPLKKLNQYTAPQVAIAIKLLQDLYTPEIRGTSATQSEIVIDSGYASEASEDENDDESRKSSVSEAWKLARSDQLERAFAIRWLTGFIARAEEWVEEASDEGSGDGCDERTKAMEDAAGLLASCAGTSASGPIIRTFEFDRQVDPSIMDASQTAPITIHLRDASLLSQDHTSVGLQTWGSSYLLAGKLVRSPSSYSLSPWCNPLQPTQATSSPLRVLELGAGTGLLSLVLGKLLHNAEVIATDFHDAVLENLRNNTASNFKQEGSLSPLSTPQVHHLDWEHIHRLSEPNPSSTSVLRLLSKPFDKPFDVIVGADIIYEPRHSEWIKSCLKVFLRRPSANEQFFFHLIIPLRPTHELETSSILAAFQNMDEVIQSRVCAGRVDDELELAVIRVVSLERLVGTGRADEVRYSLYRIGWV